MIDPRSGTDYVLPLKWDAAEHRRSFDSLTAYLAWLSRQVRIIVVDGSAPDLFAAHAEAWEPYAEHVRPDAARARNGKVAGVLTGMRLAAAEAVVIADDDVRYDLASLRAVVAGLEQHDLVGPQNVFSPMPWHALWDSARSLLNRAVAADYPGTFAVRSSTFRRMGGYDGDVLFENLELMRTVRAHGGSVSRPLGTYVSRRPTTTRGFWSQRVRQAYDDLAQPWRLATWLCLLPAAASGARGRRVVAAAVLLTPLVAEVGRRRAGGREHFPARAALMAPCWVVERSVCSWLALAQLLRGGVPYAGRRLPVAAHSPASLRRAALRSSLVSPAGPEGQPVRAVAERLERGPAASTEGNGAAVRLDRQSVHVDDPVGTAQDERTVRVRRDERDVVEHVRVVG